MSYLFCKCMYHMHPVVFCGVVAEYGPGETAAHVHEVVERHGGDAALGDGDVSSEEPSVRLWIITLDLGHTIKSCQYEYEQKHAMGNQRLQTRTSE